MNLFCSLSLILFIINIAHIEGDGIRVPLSICEDSNDEYSESIEYYGTISIGTPPQKINAKFSLTTHIINGIIVLSSYCNDSVCRDQNHRTYNPKTSKTFRSKDNFDTEILNNSVQVVPVNDTITIGNIQIPDVPFFVTAKYSKVFDNKPYDGIVELHYNSNVLQACKKIGLKNKFSFYTNISLHHNDGSVSRTEFTFTYLKFDPGVPYIIGPEDFIEKIYNTFNTKTSKISDLKVVDCETIHTLPRITFSHSNPYSHIDLTLTGNDYIKQMTENGKQICTVQLLSHRYSDWIMGSVFSRKFYTVFDQGMNRIAFAESIHDRPAQLMIFLF